MNKTILYADLIIPLSLSQTYTYAVPDELKDLLTIGKRVVVQFGAKRSYAAIVYKMHSSPPNSKEIKSILEVLDETPVVTAIQLKMWEWMSEYYMCTLGEVMAAALPPALRLESETVVTFNQNFSEYHRLNDAERATLEWIEKAKMLELTQLIKQTGKKNILGIVKQLLEKEAVFLNEELEEKVKPQTETWITISSEYHTEEGLANLNTSLGRAKKQQSFLLHYLTQCNYDITKKTIAIKRSELLKDKLHFVSTCKAMMDKGIFTAEERSLSDLEEENSTYEKPQLSKDQSLAFDEIKNGFQEKDVALLYGVTSSGKTEIYFNLISEMLNEGKQVLYMLPEIALTAQMVNRLRTVFGDRVGVYHSKYGNRERLKVWHKTKNGSFQIILGVRSSIFLPFNNLGLIIVDEEHENTYKQIDPAPRYHARDTAIVLSTMHKAKVVLGSATPSLESFFNAATGKYSLVKLTKRYGDVLLPRIEVVDVLKATKKKQMHSHFSKALMDAINDALNRDKQVILFQNRRGFSIFLQCNECGWVPRCKHCDVSLTYHKAFNKLVCHYCGYTTKITECCGECKSTDIKMKGFGTEKVEDEIAAFFPQARIARLDLDTARTRNRYEEIIRSFENHETDILIGTQMVTKGLHFDNVALVGILNADNMLNFPDFRAFERSYQLMAQVAGRAGRKDEQGLVLIQTGQANHPVINFVKNNNYEALFHTQLAERKEFLYPPYSRLMRITVKHRDSDLCLKAATQLAKSLSSMKNISVMGPDLPVTGRLQGLFIRNILLKAAKELSVQKLKQNIRTIVNHLNTIETFKATTIVVDVDC